MRLGKVSNNYLLRVGTDSTNPAITFGNENDHDGPLVGRASGTDQFITGTESGDMVVQNYNGRIFMGTSSIIPQLIFEAGGSNLTAGVQIVQFTNSATGYNPGNLDYYEEGTFEATFGGAMSSTAVQISFVRIGKKVTLCIPNINETFSGSAGPISSDADIPARIRPGQSCIGTFVVRDNGNEESGFGKLYIMIIFGKATPGNNFTGPGNVGTINATYISYLVSL